jgi:hypothetical protein
MTNGIKKKINFYLPLFFICFRSRNNTSILFIVYFVYFDNFLLILIVCRNRLEYSIFRTDYSLYSFFWLVTKIKIEIF